MADELNDLDTRLSKLELDGTMAFQGSFTSNPNIPDGTVLIFDVINLNPGNGYNAETGLFKVPPGRAGLCYAYVHFESDDGEASNMYL